MSDYAWWTPARRKLDGRPTVNGMTCQICGCDMCQCNRLVPVSDPPRTATIGEHVDAVLAAKDAEIERLRAEKATDAWHTGWQEAVRRMRQAECERDDLRALLRDTVPKLIPVVRIPNIEYVADEHNAARDRLRGALDAMLGGRDE